MILFFSFCSFTTRLMLLKKTSSNFYDAGVALLVRKHRKLGQCNIEGCRDSRTAVDTPFNIYSTGFGNRSWWDPCRRLSFLLKRPTTNEVPSSSGREYTSPAALPAIQLTSGQFFTNFQTPVLTFLNTKSTCRMANHIDDYILCAHHSSFVDTIAVTQPASALELDCEGKDLGVEGGTLSLMRLNPKPQEYISSMLSASRKLN